jgi:hypothetical protein
VKSSNLSEFSYYMLRILVVSQVMVLILPVIMLVVFSFVTSSYMRPMFHDPLGFLLLAIAAVVLVVGAGLTLLAVRMMRSGRPLLTVALLLVSTLVCAFPALWLVLLGPALVVISHQK